MISFMDIILSALLYQFHIFLDFYKCRWWQVMIHRIEALEEGFSQDWVCPRMFEDKDYFSSFISYKTYY